MKNLITNAKNPNIKVSSELLEFLSPDKVYIPISKDVTMLLRKKKVWKGTPLYQKEDRIIYSPISGMVKRITKQLNHLEEEQLFLEIHNDFQENDFYSGSLETTTILVRDIKKLIAKNEEIAKLNLQNKKSIYLNAIEDEPYIENNTFIHKLHKEEILLFLDALATVYKIKDVKIYLKENESESIEEFSGILEMYPNIKIQIVPDIYPIGNNSFLKDFLKLNEEVAIFHSEDILELYYEIVKSRKKDFIYVSVTGDGVKNPHVLKVKKGTLLSELMPLFELEENVNLYVNSLLKKKNCEIDNIIITKEIKALYFMKKESKQEKACVHCGKCNLVCPMKCSPYKSVISKGIFQKENCIHCGLCTFICPSYIEIERYLGKGEETNALR